MDAGVAAPSLEAGSIIGDRYRLKRALGEGAMGWVWEGSHVHTGKTYALKFLKGGKDEDRKRFQREVRAAAAVKHPNVVGMHDFVELPSGTLVMVMDLLEGETLGSVLKREKQIDLANLAAMTLPVIAALEAAHAVGVIHRDLKPENVFLAKTETGTIVPKVLDFGVAKLTAAEGLAARTQALTGTGSMVGTPYYMSPEQVVSEKDLDARADVWSLGVVLYECLAGVRPTEADNVGRVLKRILVADFAALAELRPDLPEDVTSLVMKMLEGDRDKRIRALSDVRAVLAKHAGEKIEEIAGKPDAVVAVDPPSPASFSRADTHRAVSVHTEKSPRSPLRFVAIGGAVLAAGVALFVWKGSAAPNPVPATIAPAPPAASTTEPFVAPSSSVSAVASASSSTSTSFTPLVPSAPPAKVQIATRPATQAAPKATPVGQVASAAPPPGTASAAAVASAPPPKPASTLATSPKD